MTKKSTSFYLADDSKIQLKMISDADKRSQANMLEIIIEEEFKKRGMKMPVPEKPTGDKPVKPKKPK